MSWSEVKKINSDMKKSLDTLIKEQFNTNNSNVSTVKNDLTTVKSDLTYIKNTQLGTNLNNLVQGSTKINFENKPLVDKVNYILRKIGDKKLVANEVNVLDSIYNIPVTSYSTWTDVFTYIPEASGNVKLITKSDTTVEFFMNYPNGSGSYISSGMNLSVEAGKSYEIQAKLKYSNTKAGTVGVEVRGSIEYS